MFSLVKVPWIVSPNLLSTDDPAERPIWEYTLQRKEKGSQNNRCIQLEKVSFTHLQLC